MTFLQLLEAKHFNRLQKKIIFEFANTSAEFSSQWLIHCIRSNCSTLELAFAIAFADRWKLTVLDDLENYLTPILDQNTASKLSFDNELRTIEQMMSGYSHRRLIKLLNQITCLTNNNKELNIVSQNLFTTQTNIPQILIDKIIADSKPQLTAVALFGDQGSDSKDTSIRNNTHFPTPLPNTMLELALLEKIMAANSNESIQFAEPAVILRYKPEQYYKWHYDHIYPHNEQIQQQINQFGQRKKTAIFYLNDNFSGGETEFKSPFVSVKPKQGQIATFNNCDPAGKRLTQSLHRGTEVVQGEKWIITLWFRDKPFWLRTGFL
ncbi:MAG: proline hydroxylase [Gammaproteobacteria bacterium]|nr:MAG: proline hydroxylase [Gammaproteobacteria bacterium]